MACFALASRMLQVLVRDFELMSYKAYTTTCIFGCKLPSTDSCSKLPNDDRLQGGGESSCRVESMHPRGQPASRPHWGQSGSQKDNSSWSLKKRQAKCAEPGQNSWPTESWAIKWLFYNPQCVCVCVLYMISVEQNREFRNWPSQYGNKYV